MATFVGVNTGNMADQKPTLFTCFSPALLHLYDVNEAIVVIIDVFRATSTIASALQNGAKCVIPVDTVAKAVEISKRIDGIAAGERDGKIAFVVHECSARAVSAL